MAKHAFALASIIHTHDAFVPFNPVFCDASHTPFNEVVKKCATVCVLVLYNLPKDNTNYLNELILSKFKAVILIAGNKYQIWQDYYLDHPFREGVCKEYYCMDGLREALCKSYDQQTREQLRLFFMNWFTTWYPLKWVKNVKDFN